MPDSTRVAVRTQPRIAIAMLVIFVSATALGVFLGRTVWAPEPFEPFTPGARFSEDQFLVRFKPGTPATSVRALNASERVTEKARIPRIDVRVMTVPQGRTVEDIVRRYARNPNVEFAEPDYIAATLFTPNDPEYPRQWGLPAIAAPAAWDVTRGSSGVVVAVVDTGVWATHPDLNGQVLPGRDFVQGDDDPSDPNGHGTKVAGIIAAATNNGLGVAAVAGGSRILPVRSLDSNGSGTMTMIANGIIWAADNGARVINMSFGSAAYSSSLASAVSYARGKGCVLVGAAGNDGAEQVVYPAGLPDVIGVGAVGNNTGVMSWSNRGSHVSVVAPGSLVYTTVLATNTSTGAVYGTFSGTSAAAPHVSGAAALLIAADPSRSAAVVRDLLERTATDISPTGWDSASGWGRIDIAAAIGSAAPGGGQPAPEPPPAPAPEPTPAPPAPADTTAPEVTITAPVNAATVSGTLPVRVMASDDRGVASVEFLLNGVRMATDSSAPFEWSWNTTKSANGPYDILARAKDAAGNTGQSTVVRVTVSNTKGKPK